jgi:SecD-like export protein
MPAGLLILAVVAGACGSDAATPGDASRSTGATEPSAGAFQMRPVLEVLDPGASEASTCPASDGTCAAEHAGDARTVLEAGDGSRYAVGPAAVDETDVASAEPVEGTPTCSVSVQLTPEGTSALEELTSASMGDRLAIVVGGTVITTPTVNATISSGHLVVPSTTLDAATALADTIDGAS